MSRAGQTQPRSARIICPHWPVPPALTGILYAIGGTLIFSINDVSIKFLSDGYALHQVILIRAFVAMAFILGVIAWSERGFSQIGTSRPGAHLLRVVIVMVSNVTFFVGLAAMPLADAIAVAYVSPIVVTLLSIVSWVKRSAPALGSRHHRHGRRHRHAAPRGLGDPACRPPRPDLGHPLRRRKPAGPPYGRQPKAR